jgi:ribonuclease HI
MKRNGFTLVSDGACSGNPGNGGWGLILVIPNGTIKEFGGSEETSTNNRMELMGYYRGLQEVYKMKDAFPDSKIVHAISDSKYVLEGAKTNLTKWAETGWKTTAGTEVKNRDLWEKILKGQQLLKDAGFRLEYELVKGHAGNEGNERADQIAVKYCKKEAVKLYDGPVSDYPIALETKAAFKPVYLSFVDGVLKRHSTWDECKQVVEGKKGVKYKKVSNSLEERETLALWGVN